MDIDLCRFDGFVAEPECDHRLVDAMLQQLHRRAVPEDVGTDTLVGERRAGDRRDLGMLMDEMFERVTAQPVTADRREERIVRGPAPLLEPAFQQMGGVAA